MQTQSPPQQHEEARHARSQQSLHSTMRTPHVGPSRAPPITASFPSLQMCKSQM